jgi:hypothetical protein
VSSENPTGADNQQETAGSRLELEPHWVVGFVDGEGCFSVSIHRNPNARTTGGWQLHPVLHVYQHVRYRAVLEEFVVFFGCGRVRPKGPKSSVWTYAVDSLKRLEGSILPFFERYPLVVKQADFRNFTAIVRMMRQREHLTADGFRTCRAACLRNECERQAARTNPRRDPDGILRDCTLGTIQGSATPVVVKGQSDPHGDMGSQAEMT